MFNRKTFFNKVRGLFGGSLSQKQVDGMSLILQYAEDRGSDVTDLAYILATTKHETADTMQPIREYGSDRYFFSRYDPAGSKPHIANQLGNIEKGDGVKFCGRGYVMITGRRNYKLAGDKLGYDFISDPDMVMDPMIAVEILFKGMEEGWFTGKELDDYIDDDENDDNYSEYLRARYIVNGKDKRTLIAKYAVKFEKALKASYVVNSKPMSKSRTAKGAGVGALVGSVSLVEPVQEVSEVLSQQQGNLSSGTIVGLLVGIVAVGAAAYVLYSRWDDSGRPVFWG